MSSLITEDLVTLDVDLGRDRADVIRYLAGRVAATGRATNADDLFADAWARESKTDTGIPGGIAIPHCRSAAPPTSSSSSRHRTAPTRSTSCCCRSSPAR